MYPLDSWHPQTLQNLHPPTTCNLLPTCNLRLLASFQPATSNPLQPPSRSRRTSPIPSWRGASQRCTGVCDVGKCVDHERPLGGPSYLVIQMPPYLFRPPTFEQKLDQGFNKILDFILAKGVDIFHYLVVHGMIPQLTGWAPCRGAKGGPRGRGGGLHPHWVHGAVGDAP